MADIKFSEFPKATTSKDSDELAILQDGVNKMIPSPVLESKIINKTVSRVIEQGGASLNVINLKGVVPTYADLSLITPTPQLNDAYQVEADGLVYVYTENGFQTEGEGFVVQPEPNGVVEEGNTQAVSGGEAYESILISENNQSGYLGYNFLLGEVSEISDFSSSIDLTQGTVILNEKFTDLDTLSIKLQAITAGDITIGSYKIENNIASRSKFLTIPIVVGENTISNFKVNEGEYFGFSYNMTSNPARVGALNESSYYSYFTEAVNISTGTTLNPSKNNQKLGIKIEAVKKDSLVNDVQESIKETDLSFKLSENLLNNENRVLDKYINSLGAIVDGAGWEMASIDVSSFEVGQEITINGITISAGHLAWYNSESLVSYGGSYTTVSQPLTVTKPSNATILYIDTMRDNISNDSVMVNLGSEALPYKEYEDPKINGILGYDLVGDNNGGGTSYNQSLNTTDNVQFQSLTTQGLKVFLPTSDVGLETGDVWVDASNSNVLKVK